MKLLNSMRLVGTGQILRLAILWPSDLVVAEDTKQSMYLPICKYEEIKMIPDF